MTTKTTEEPKGTTVKELDKTICMIDGTTVATLAAGKKVNLTRRLAVTQALENHSDTVKGDKFIAFDLGMRFAKANGKVSISSEESAMIKVAAEKNWPQPGIYVPLCCWLEGA